MTKPSITKNKINKSERLLLDWIQLATVISLPCSFTVNDAAILPLPLTVLMSVHTPM
ncbi:hypothetical protein DPMN_014744 [Dreissena polymorpha]|uniref:Uncharacterized protein n=1 Tax=Dreissena polymorpha TaxID=45954 RepID=A0A9D4NBJ1_DREPO|nr:hypothetical protein DPMN_014744 [Dreissena polymorpha]